MAQSADFAVLMAVYGGERPQRLQAALESVWDAQTLRPAALVLVCDGPLGAALDELVQRWQRRLGARMQLVRLPAARGLGAALQSGALACRQPLMARMDSDDLALPHRFALQYARMQQEPQLDMLGGWVAECRDPQSDERGRLRRVPQTHTQIAAFARRRCPFNHPTLMLRRAAVLRAGNYRPGMLEDYWLWARMLMAGARAANLQEVLVRMRADRDFAARRGGWRYARAELALYRRLHRIGFLSAPAALAQAALRLPARLSPRPLRRLLYQTLRTPL